MTKVAVGGRGVGANDKDNTKLRFSLSVVLFGSLLSQAQNQDRSGGHKEMSSIWLTISALVYEPNAGVTWSPNKLWRSNSIFNL